MGGQPGGSVQPRSARRGGQVETHLSCGDMSVSGKEAGYTWVASQLTVFSLGPCLLSLKSYKVINWKQESSLLQDLLSGKIVQLSEFLPQPRLSRVCPALSPQPLPSSEQRTSTHSGRVPSPRHSASVALPGWIIVVHAPVWTLSHQGPATVFYSFSCRL